MRHLTIDTPLKWTTEDGKSCHGGDHDWIARPTLVLSGNLVPCKYGIHLASIRQAIQHRWLAPGVFDCRITGATIEQLSKTVVRRVTVTRRLTWNRRLLVLWAADCAEHAASHLTIASRQAIETARRWACGLATTQECRAAATAATAANAAYAADAANAAYASAAAANAAANAAAYAYAAAANADYAASAAAYAANAAAYANAAAAAERIWQAERLLDYLMGRLPVPAESYRCLLLQGSLQ